MVITDDGVADRVSMLGQPVGLVLIGCAIGLVVNVLVFPPLRYRRAEYGVTNLAHSLGDLVGDIAGAPARPERDRGLVASGRQPGLDGQAGPGGPVLMRTRPSPDHWFELADRLAAGEHICSIVSILYGLGRGSEEAEPAFLRRNGEFLTQLRRRIDELSEIDPDRLHRERFGLEQENAAGVALGLRLGVDDRSSSPASP